MISGINNNIPSFKRAYIDDASKKNFDDIFSTKFGKKALKRELSRLDRMSGNRDIFLSANYSGEHENSDGKYYELTVSDKQGKPLARGIMISNKDSVISLNSTFGILHCILKPQLEKKD